MFKAFFLKHSLPKSLERVYITPRISQYRTAYKFIQEVLMKTNQNNMYNWMLRHIRALSENIDTLVNKAPISAEEKNLLQQYTVFLLLGIPTMVIYGIYNLTKSNYMLCTLIFISALGLSVGWYFLGKLKRGIIVYRINSILFGLLVLYMLMVGGEGGSKILWMYTFPLIVIFLLGKNEGIFWTGGQFAISLALLWTPPNWFTVFNYDVQFRIRFATIFVIVSAIAYWFEYLRHKYRIGMESEHRKLQEEKILLRHQIEEREKAEKEKGLLITQLQQALLKVKLLSGFLPICASCKKIRDDKGYWNQIEAYIQDHSEAEFSHGICPECMKKLYPDFVN